MKRTRFSREQAANVPREAEEAKMAELARRRAVGDVTVDA